jgi:hypothetical protein
MVVLVSLCIPGHVKKHHTSACAAATCTEEAGIRRQYLFMWTVIPLFLMLERISDMSRTAVKWLQKSITNSERK